LRVGLFPGQGVPALKVLNALSADDPLVATASEVVGFDVRRRVEIAARRKGASLPTVVAQPAIFVAGVSSLHRARDGQPTFDFLAGHSLGEYTALVAGGALDFEDALALVKARAEAMETAARSSPGAMAAVLGLDLAEVESIAGRAGAMVANDNAPGQVVVSGTEDALARTAALVRAAGARSVLLEVAGPFHTGSMAPASSALSDALDRVHVRMPSTPVVSNVTAKPYGSAEEIKELLIRQPTERVRFRESLEWVWGRGAREFHDLGPGTVVANLAQKTFRALEKSEVSIHA
jgi:[acyl-carrier-protein] S-malonyltransferase